MTTAETETDGASVEATIEASTLTTLNPVRDAKMHGPELLDVERYPTIDFISTGLSSSGENYFELDGRLIIHAVTKDVSLDLVFNGVVTDTWGKRRLGSRPRPNSPETTSVPASGATRSYPVAGSWFPTTSRSRRTSK